MRSLAAGFGATQVTEPTIPGGRFRSSPVRWCARSSRDTSATDQTVKAGVTSSEGSVTVSAALPVWEQARSRVRDSGGLILNPWMIAVVDRRVR